MALDYDISLASTTLRRTLRSTSDLRRAFFRSYYKKMREMHDKHEFLIVQAKIILHQNRDQPSKLVKLISSTFTSTNYFDPNYRCKTMEDNTLLTLACRNGQMKCMKLLVDRFNADVNIADIGGFTPLILCAYHGNFSGVLYLLSKAASLSAMGKLRSGLPLTAEHWAAIQGHGEIFRYLHALRRRTVRRYIPICNVKIETQLKMESNAKTERGKVTTETEIILAETGPTESMLTSIREATSDESVQPSSSRINSSSAPSAMSVEEPLDSLLPTFLLFADEYFDVVGDAGLPKLPGQVSSPIQSHNENKFQVTASSSHNVSVDNDELTVVASTSCDSNSAVVPSVASSGLIAPSVSSSSSSSNSSDNGGDVAASNPTQVTEDSTYCYCRKGFEGQMIGCDAADCPVEWFHYRCVGLQARVSFYI